MKSFLSSVITFALVATHAAGALAAEWMSPEDVESLVAAKMDSLPVRVKAEAENAGFREKLTEYVLSLNLPADEKKADRILSRILQSSTQFLYCEDMEDWACLEKKPVVSPTVVYRYEKEDDLGKAVLISEPLKIEYFFTQRWANRLMGLPDNETTVAAILGQKILTEAKDGLYMALYGIDDIQDSMKPVFEAVRDRVQNKIEIQAVVDVSGEGAPNSFLRNYDLDVKKTGVTVKKLELADIDFSYFEPKNGAKNWAWGRPSWMDTLRSGTISPDKVPRSDRYEKDAYWLIKQPGGQDAIRLAFQYKETRSLVTMINAGIKSNEQAGARIEYPMAGIMHNKFAVMKAGNNLSVWSGTANIARTCMGDENNSNMSIFIRNTEVAKAFLDEFYEMHAYDKTNKKLIEKVPTLVTGRFHQVKSPNTKRYFKFVDGHELRVHFSPTDDGEHRVIIPMIETAKTGDVLRISMFGAGGLEIVRALQKAAARGVKIQIILDNLTGSQSQGWLKNPDGNLFEENPYKPGAEKNIELRLSTWKDGGLNHHKSASLTRADGRVEVLTVGSQNWSASGNDKNDENMVTIRHRTKNLSVGQAFNENFDKFMFPLGVQIERTADGKIQGVGQAIEIGGDGDGEDSEEGNE